MEEKNEGIFNTQEETASQTKNGVSYLLFVIMALIYAAVIMIMGMYFPVAAIKLNSAIWHMPGFAIFVGFIMVTLMQGFKENKILFTMLFPAVFMIGMFLNVVAHVIQLHGGRLF